jgi:ribonuclease-3
MFAYPKSPSDEDLSQLQARLGVTFHNKELLLQALTHRSWVEEAARGGLALAHQSYGRLAFLGDAKLGEVVARTLFEAHPTAVEGGLTRAAEVFKRESWLIAQGRALGLGDLMRVGRGAEVNLQGHYKVIEHSMEAVLGALVADGQGDAVERIVTDWINSYTGLQSTIESTDHECSNPVGAINELYQRKLRMSAPAPEAWPEGTPQDLSWHVRLDLTAIGLSVYPGSGRSKRAAKADACRVAYQDAVSTGLL